MINTPFHLPYNPKLVARAKEMRRNPTPAEKKLWQQYLRTFPARILRQHPIANHPIANFIVDFYCSALRLVIEVDGDRHFTEEGQAYDAERSQVLESYGLMVLRFTNAEVLQNFESVCDRIAEVLPPKLRDKSP